MMRAVRVSQFGGPDVCQLAEVPVPKAAENEVLIRVEAAGVNPVDTYIRSGTYGPGQALPYTPGKDAAGTVVQAPKGSQFEVGQRVYCCHGNSGTYAEYCIASPGQVWPLPSRLSFQQGAALGVPYHTAYRALFQKCHAKAGETVLIHGASGGVGVAAVQVAKAGGLRVLGTAGTAEGAEIVKDLGADAVFNHREPGYEDKIKAETVGGEGVDVVLEMLANVNLNRDLDLVCGNGRIAVIGNRGTVEVDARRAMAKESSVHGVALLRATPAEWAEAADWLGTKEGISPVIGALYRLEDAAKAQHDIINSAGAKGKTILDVSSST